MKTTSMARPILKSHQRDDFASQPRPCATEGCAATVEGRAVYCGKCRHIRQRRAQRDYRERTRYDDDPLPAGPPTSMAWLRKFDGWSKSGMSYADYQKAARK